MGGPPGGPPGGGPGGGSGGGPKRGSKMGSRIGPNWDLTVTGIGPVPRLGTDSRPSRNGQSSGRNVDMVKRLLASLRPRLNHANSYQRVSTIANVDSSA